MSPGGSLLHYSHQPEYSNNTDRLDNVMKSYDNKNESSECEHRLGAEIREHAIEW